MIISNKNGGLKKGINPAHFKNEKKNNILP
jgi:hypothetical protein